MARVSRRFPGHVLVGSRQALAVPQATTTPRLITPIVVASPVPGEDRRHVRSQVITNRWPGYQWVGLPPVAPLPKQVVIDDATWTAVAQQNRARSSNVYQPRPVAEEVVTGPTKSVVVGQAEPASLRGFRNGSIITNRWSGYQWVGLPPVAPLPHAVVQDQAAVWQARQDHRRGQVIQPQIQAAAAAAGVPPPIITPTKPVIVGQAVQHAAAEQNRERRTHIVQNRWSGYQWVGLPPVTPLPKQVVVDQAAMWQETRGHRHGSVIQPDLQIAAAAAAPPIVTPLPRQVVVMARPVAQRRRPVHVITCRPASAPITLPTRPNVVHTTPQRRRGHGGIVYSAPQRFVPHGIQPTLITTPATGYVSAGGTGPPAAGSSGRPGVGDTGAAKAGASGQVRI